MVSKLLLGMGFANMRVRLREAQILLKTQLGRRTANLRKRHTKRSFSWVQNGAWGGPPGPAFGRLDLRMLS